MTRGSWPKLLLLCAAIVPFCGSVNSGFHFDDYAIFEDAAIRAPKGWLAVWNFGETRPLTYLTFWLNYRLDGENPIGSPRRTCSSMVWRYRALRAFGGVRDLVPGNLEFCAALIFAVHPIQAEAVNYVPDLTVARRNLERLGW